MRGGDVRVPAPTFANSADLFDGSEPSLPELALRFRRWLFGAALPLWSTVGADPEGWGFEEQLDLEARPRREPRRARVQARQVYVFAKAGQLGWGGPWKACVERGLEALRRNYRRADGLCRTLVDADGRVIDDTAKLYDQAFVLLALASAAPQRAEAASEADAVLEALSPRRHSAGGFREAGDRPFLSNPHMHLFEAALAWLDAGPTKRWEALAGELADLALDRFIDPQSGVLREIFDADWRPARGEDGRLVEPGHQFEWAWLLERWSRRSGDPRAAKTARRLFTVGLKGVDPVRDVAVDALNDDGTIRSATARLWPQTERLKAALILGQDDQAKAAARALWRYVAIPTPGLWRDRLTPDNTFVEEQAPASSLYHIVAAADELLTNADI